MQNLNGRLALNQANTYSLKANNYKHRGFIDPVSSLNPKKNFRVENKKVQAISNMNNNRKKKNLTFNQLLSKFGYI